MALADHVKRGTDARIKRWSILIYSYPGSGKTTLAAQAPRPLILELDENGWIVLSNPLVAENVRYVVLRDFERTTKFIRALAKDELLQAVDTIVLDTVSELQTLERLSQLSGDPLLEARWKFNEHIYTVNNFKVLLLVKELLALNKNTILLCHMKEEDLGDSSSKRKIIRPALSPALLTDIMSLVDGTFFLHKENNTRRLQLQGTTDVLLKSRFNRNGTIVDPTFNKLLPVLEEYKETKTQENKELTNND